MLKSRSSIPNPSLGIITIFRDMDGAVYFKSSDGSVHLADSYHDVYRIDKPKFSGYTNLTGERIDVLNSGPDEFIFALSKDGIIAGGGGSGARGRDGRPGATGATGATGGSVIPFAVEINFVSTTGDTTTLSADTIVGTAVSYLWKIKSSVTVPNNFTEGVGGIINVGPDNLQQATFSIGQGQIAMGEVSCQVTDANGQVTLAYWWMLLNIAA